ncbi:glutamyl/glutaminyl-tRNA synthetase, class Ic [Artemisia annua]|uniref:Glutamyl/glutaminyl-tRNA synthetase, class Ic n=1 Tax=Artemisia annua TaxID=35608 RepID=A0A2U1LR61_ARTAN|nr:glutamyl/glutaminyl-tRNA synthetase, class Ic [Artemisia annua]
MCISFWKEFIICFILKLDEDEDFIDALNPDTKKEIGAVGDANMRNLKCGDILLLERKGYFRCDVPFIRPSKPIVLYASRWQSNTQVKPNSHFV